MLYRRLALIYNDEYLYKGGTPQYFHINVSLNAIYYGRLERRYEFMNSLVDDNVFEGRSAFSRLLCVLINVTA